MVPIDWQSKYLASVLPCRSWIFQRLEVGGNSKIRQSEAQFRFQPFQQVVTLLHGPGARCQHMHRNKTLRGGLARAQFVVSNPNAHAKPQRRKEEPLRLCGLA